MSAASDSSRLDASWASKAEVVNLHVQAVLLWKILLKLTLTYSIRFNKEKWSNGLASLSTELEEYSPTFQKNVRSIIAADRYWENTSAKTKSEKITIKVSY